VKRGRTIALVGMGAVAGLVVLGGLAAVFLGARNPDTSVVGPTATTPTSLPFRRFFADDASWNRPVSDFGPSERYARYAEVFHDWAGGEDTSTRGRLGLKFEAYSVPIYDAATATTTVHLYQTVWSQNIGRLGNIEIGTEVPWNPQWAPGTQSDRIMAVVDYATGRTWEYWGVGEPPTNCFDFAGPNVRAGFNPLSDRDVCLAGASTYDNLFTASDRDGTTIDGRGMGINKLALVTRADEVLEGEIRHALELSVTNTLFGEPACDPIDDGTAPGAGRTCGFYLPPATKLEWSAGTAGRCGEGQPIDTSDENRARMVPEGLRIALRITDTEIEAWLDDRGYEGARRRTARIFAVALRDYGAIVAETGCWGVGIETDGLVDPVSRGKWARAGIVDDGTDNPAIDLLDGLVTEERLYVVEPPG